MITQGSKEWFNERAPRITTSRFGDVIANPSTKRYQNYKDELICNLQGAPHMEDDKPWFNHGKELEPIAISRYEFEMFLRGEEIHVLPGGFNVHPKYDFIGSSPDGNFVPKMALEVKSSKSYANYRKLAKTALPSSHKPQVQGELWVGEYDAIDFVLFFRDPDGIMKDEITINRIFPDLGYHDFLEAKCLEFWGVVQSEIKGA